MILQGYVMSNCNYLYPLGNFIDQWFSSILVIPLQVPLHLQFLNILVACVYFLNIWYTSKCVTVESMHWLVSTLYLLCQNVAKYCSLMHEFHTILCYEVSSSNNRSNFVCEECTFSQILSNLFYTHLWFHRCESYGWGY